MWLSSLYNEPIKSPSLMGVGGTEKTSRGPALFAGTEGPEQGRKGGFQVKKKGESWAEATPNYIWCERRLKSSAWLFSCLLWPGYTSSTSILSLYGFGRMQ